MTTTLTPVNRATRGFYDRYSYDFGTGLHDSMQLETTLLGEALQGLPPGAVVVDAGCGTGLVSRLARTHVPGARVIGVDLSLGSLRRAQTRSPVPLAQGNILILPLRSGSADLVVSRGVIMTTGQPRRAFGELARVVRPGGRLFVRVYNQRNWYRWLYSLGSPVCRAIAALPGGKTLLAVTVVPFFVLAVQLALLAMTGRLTWFGPRVAWNFFADQLLTPHNSFHTLDEVRAWGAEEGLGCLGTRTITLGQQLDLLFAKQVT